MLNLEKEQYTKEEVMELFTPFTTELEELKTKVSENDKVNLANAIKLEMTKNGLDAESLYDLVDAESLEKAQAKINKLVDIRKKEKLSNSFRPDDKKGGNDEYSQHEKTGNVEGMLKSKLSKLFE